MSEYDASSLKSVDPTEFARAVKKMPGGELKSIMHGEERGAVLDEVFGRMPGLFRPDRAGSMHAVVHWHITGRPDGGVDTYELVIGDGKCLLSPKPESEPRLALTLDAVDFLKVVSSNANPMMMFMTGKLKAKGDLGLAANIANLFNMPKA